MQLKRLRLFNFRQHAETEIVLGPGITAIVGPNGSGKTTLLEAISWAFYGNPAARGVKDSIRRHQAPARSQVKVEVDFTLGSHEFRVERGLYNAALYQDGRDTPIAGQSQEVASRVTRLLGMNRDEFFNTYFTGQKELAVMASMGATDRARFLSRVLGYAKLKRVQDKLRETRTRLRGEIAGLEQGLADEATLTAEQERWERSVAESRREADRARSTFDAATQELDTIKPAWQQMVERREMALTRANERRVVQRDVGEAARAFERVSNALAEATAATSKVQELASDLARIPALSQELESLERQAQQVGRRRSLRGQLNEVKSQRKRLEEELARMRGVDEALVEARRMLTDSRTELENLESAEERARTDWIRDKQDAETKRQSLRDEYRELSGHRAGIVEAGPDGQCPTCTRPLGSEYETVLDGLAKQLEEIEIKGKFYTQRVTQLEREPAEVVEAATRTQEGVKLVEKQVEAVARAENRVRERTDGEAELRGLGERIKLMERELVGLADRYDADRHEEVRAERRGLDPVVTLATQLQLKAEQRDRLNAEATEAKHTLASLTDRLQALDAAITDAGFSETDYDAMRIRYETVEAAVRKAELALATAVGDVKAAEVALAQATKRIEERAKQVKQSKRVRRELLLHDELHQAFHDLRLELNAEMRPELADRASSFLTDLTDGRYNALELDDQYRILAIEDGFPKPVISGGEEDLANLVLRLAISEMVAERAGQPLSMLVLDEIFGGLDEARRHNVVDLLRRLGDRFPQVVLITHIESVKEGVDRVLRVSLDQHRASAVVTEDLGLS